MQVQQLLERTEGCRQTLHDLDKFLKQYHGGLAKGHKTINRFNWAAQRGRDIRNRLISNVVMLSAFFNSVNTATVFRLEADTRAHMERLYGQQQRILHPPEQELSRRPEWNELVRDLEDMGITAEELSSNRAFIVDSIVKSISQSWMEQRREAEEGQAGWDPWAEYEGSMKAHECDPDAPLALPAPDPLSTLKTPSAEAGSASVISPPLPIANSPSHQPSQDPPHNSSSPFKRQSSVGVSPKMTPSQASSQSGTQPGSQPTTRPKSKSSPGPGILSSKPPSKDENITSTRDASALDDPETRVRLSGLIQPGPAAHHRRSRSGSVSRDRWDLRRLSKDHRSSSVPSRRQSIIPPGEERRSSFAIAFTPQQGSSPDMEGRNRSSDGSEAWQKDADQLCRFWNCQDWSSSARFLQKLHTCGKPLGGPRLAQHMLGICASFSGRFEEAKGHFWSVITRPIRSVRDLDHADIAAARWLGDACLNLGEVEDAVFSYVIALGGLRSYENALYDFAACQIRAEIEVVLRITNGAWEEMLSSKMYSEERNYGGGLFDASLITDEGIHELLPVFLTSCKHQNMQQDCLRGMFDEISNLGHVRASVILGRDLHAGNPYALTFVSPDVLANVTPQDRNYFLSCDPFFSVSRTSLIACDFRQPSYLTAPSSHNNTDHGLHTEGTKLDYKTDRKASWIKKTLTGGLPLPGFKFIQVNSSTLLCAYLEPWRRITFYRTFAITMMKIPSSNTHGVVVHGDPAEALRKGAIGSTSVAVEHHPMTTRIIDPIWHDHRRHQINLNVVPVIKKFLKEAENRENDTGDHQEGEHHGED
ncbi:hypothetical protein EV356DRAFT_322201 [Viridothelium virens]|uniref:Uncharacterized protein n=1 Tax=Viridothelium virens TaxID=1048519 RepID=A0A6A6GZU4_VIRVR|nr:hypothetical protein EV356DRAFT_322201 [Viridothelium virens]